MLEVYVVGVRWRHRRQQVMSVMYSSQRRRFISHILRDEACLL